MADGHKIEVPYVRPVEIHFKNRRCFTGAMVLGDEPQLGAIPLEDMDLVVIPSRLTLDVNPLSPNVPLSLAKKTITHHEQTTYAAIRRRAQIH